MFGFDVYFWFNILSPSVQTRRWMLRINRSLSTDIGLTEVDTGWGRVQLGSVQFSTLTDRVVDGAWGTIRQRFSTSLFCGRPLWAVLAWAGMSALSGCPSSISSAYRSVVHPPRCPEGWFWRGCPGVWHSRSLCLLTVARSGSCWPTRKLILLRTQSLVFCYKKKIRRRFLRQSSRKCGSSSQSKRGRAEG